MARIVRAGEASSEAERRNEGSTKCVRNSEKPVFCEAKSHPKNKNLKLDICPIKYLNVIEKQSFFTYYKKTYSDYHGIENAAKNHFKK